MSSVYAKNSFHEPAGGFLIRFLNLFVRRLNKSWKNFKYKCFLKMCLWTIDLQLEQTWRKFIAWSPATKSGFQKLFSKKKLPENVLFWKCQINSCQTCRDFSSSFEISEKKSAQTPRRFSKNSKSFSKNSFGKSIFWTLKSIFQNPAKILSARFPKFSFLKVEKK